MAEELTNLSYMATLIAIGFAGGVSGYIFRRLQKFEDTIDELRARILPSIYAATRLFLQTVEQFKEENISGEELRTKFEDIEKTLKTKIFELGGVALLKESKQKNIFDFYLNFSMLSAGSKILDEPGLRTKFKEGQEIAGISLGSLQELAEQVRVDVLNELKEYRRKLPFIMVLIFGLLGVVSAIIALLGK